MEKGWKITMFQADYKKNFEKYYLILQEEKEVRSFSLQEQMLINNKINGILPLEIRFLNNVRFYYYEIDHYRSLSSFYEKHHFKMDEIKRILTDTLQIILNAKQFLLEEDDFILSFEFIFQHVEEKKINLCYYSGYQQNLHLQITKFLELFMNMVDYKDKDTVAFIYSLYMESKEEYSTLQHLLSLIHETSLESESIEKKEKYLFPNDGPVPVFSETSSLSKTDPKTTYPIWCYVAGGTCLICTILILLIFYTFGFFHNSINHEFSIVPFLLILLPLSALLIYAETKIFSKKYQQTVSPTSSPSYQSIQEIQMDSCSSKKYETQTILLNQSLENFYFLLPKDQEKESIPIRFFPFIIGKSELQADYLLMEEGISRVHAIFEQIEENCYLSDRCSTNGTFLNKERLSPESRIPVKPGDEITFANTSYIFQNSSNHL